MPLITLTTDIGQQDFIIGAIKGQMHSKKLSIQTADISHYLPQSNFAHAAYICKNAFKFYPEKTFHIVLLNVFESVSDHFLIALYNNQFIICPDNGILTMIAGNIPATIGHLPLLQAKNMMEITQVLIDAIGQIISGKPLSEICTINQKIVEKSMLKPMIGNNWMEGQILFIDNFENVIINITKDEFEQERKGRKFKIVFKRNETIETLSDNYATVHEGEYLAWFNSASYLELAMNKGNVAGLFGLQGFNDENFKQGNASQNKWFYQTIRVFFEG